jgi:hypothetical protein
VIALHRVESDAEGRPALVLERWGNLDLPPMRAILARFGFGLIRAPTAQTRLPAHTYPGLSPGGAAGGGGARPGG